MRRLASFLLLSAACAGCAAPRGVPRGESVSGPDDRPGGEVRVVVGAALTRDDLARSLVGAPLVDPRVVRRLGSGTDDACRRYAPAADGLWSGGAGITATDLARSLEDRLRRGGPEARWLLSPLLDPLLEDEVALRNAVRAEGGTLAICAWRSAPDLETRLRHPVLWITRGTIADGTLEGPGRFSMTPEGDFVPTDRPAGKAAAIDRVRPVPDDGSTELVLRLGNADLAVVLGPDAGSVDEGQGGRYRLVRAPGWDRTYFLWFGPVGRYAGDPAFRRWVDGTLDRETIVRVLLGGRGEPAVGLVPEGDGEPSVPPAPRRPFSAGSRPRLSLVHDAADPWAARLAARLREALRLRDVELTVSALGRGEPGSNDARDRADLVLECHCPATPDPVLALGVTSSRLPNVPAAALDRLERASWAEGGPDRERGAAAVERDLERDARLVPLVRVHAWLAIDARLQGVVAGPCGVLSLERARWTQ